MEIASAGTDPAFAKASFDNLSYRHGVLTGADFERPRDVRYQECSTFTTVGAFLMEIASAGTDPAFAKASFDNLSYRHGVLTGADFVTDPDTDELSSAGIDGAALSFEYSEVGQIEDITDATNNVTRTLEYDYFRRLKQVTIKGNAADFASEVHSYTYFGTDWMRQSATATTCDPTTGYGLVAQETTYEYDGFNCLRQTTIVKTFIFDVNGDPVLDANGEQTYTPSAPTETEYVYYGNTPMWETTNAVTQVYVHNGRGNIIGLRAQDGTVTENRVYDSYGVIMEDDTDLQAAPPVHYSRPGYRGEFKDWRTGYVYLRHRYYWPETGRFISKDPIEDGWNWHVYASADPVNNVDPTGLKRIEINLDGSYTDENIKGTQVNPRDVYSIIKDSLKVTEPMIVKTNTEVTFLSIRKLVILGSTGGGDNAVDVGNGSEGFIEVGLCDGAVGVG